MEVGPGRSENQVIGKSSQNSPVLVQLFCVSMLDVGDGLTKIIGVGWVGALCPVYFYFWNLFNFAKSLIWLFCQLDFFHFKKC